MLQHTCQVHFIPLKRKNAKVPLPPCLVYLAHIGRQQAKTAFSLIDRKMPKHIRAVSAEWFLLKFQAAVIAYAFDRLMA